MFKFDGHTTDTMAVANLNLPGFPTFDLTEKDTLKTRWNKYLKHFHTLCKAIDVTDDGQKLSMLLSKCMKFTKISLLWRNLHLRK